ncbi:MAG: flippase [Candidatus Goldbacteria bacterium]|nr:flippase [Candidatus Goldiibacteriota bacterium]
MASISIKKNYFYNVILTSSNIIAPLIIYPYVLRILGPDGIGKVNFALSVMGYFLMVAQFGIPLYGIKEIAKVRDDKEKLNRVFSELFFINVITFIFSFILYILVIFLVPKFRNDFILYFIIGMNLFFNLFTIDWFYSGLEEYKYITIRSVAVRVLYIISIYFFIHTEKDYVIYAALGVFSLILSNFINFIFLLKKIRIIFFGLDFKKYLKPIFWIFFAAVIGSVYNKMDVILLGFMTEDKYVGFYTTNRRITSLILAFVSALGTVLIPRLSYYINNNKVEEYKKLAEKSINFIYFISVPSIIFLIIFAKEILLFFGGEKFLPASLSLQLISFQILMTSLATFFGFQVILANNDEKIIMFSNISGAIVNIVINLLFIKKYLHNTPSFAIVASEFAVVLTQIILAKKYINFRIFSFQSFNYFIAGFILLLLLFIIKSYIYNFILLMLVSIILFGLIYFAYLLFIKDEIIMMIKDTLINKLKHSKKF